MIIAVQGTSSFKDYNVFLRSMSVALSGMQDNDNEFIIYSAGPAQINSYALEFTNLSERGMKSRGKKIKCYKVAPQWILDNINSVNYFAFLCSANDSKNTSKLVKLAELNNIEVGIFKY